MSSKLRRYSNHATTRQEHRNISDEQARQAVRFGSRIPQRKNRAAYYLGPVEVAYALSRGVDLSDCLHTAVVLAADGTVVTVIRTSDVERLRRCGRR